MAKRISNPTGKGGAKPGEVRNPNGRPPNTKFFSDYIKEFANLTEEEIQKIADKAREPAGKRLAAKEFIAALNGACSSVERILNRSEGAPLTRAEIKSESVSHVDIEYTDDADLIRRSKALFENNALAGDGTLLPLPTSNGRSNGFHQEH